MSGSERRVTRVRATAEVLGLVAALLVWPGSARAADFTWNGACGADWMAVCDVGDCGPGDSLTLWGNSWGMTACDVDPAFPGAADRAFILGDFDATLAADASVATLEVSDTSTCAVSGVGNELVVGSDLDISSASAQLRVQAGAVLTFGGAAITNQGELLVQGHPVPSEWSTLSFPAATELNGVGTLDLRGGYLAGAGPLTNAAGHTIGCNSADGVVLVPLVNEGLVDADDGTIELANNWTTNNGTMRGFDLKISTHVTQGPTGRIEATYGGSYGGVWLLDGASIVGGTTDSPNPDHAFHVWGTSASIADVANTGTWLVDHDGTLTVGGTHLTNHGTIQVGQTGDTASTVLFDGDMTVDGSGTISLLSGGNLMTSGGATLTNGADHVITGKYSATITAAVDNLGTLRANGVLNLDPVAPGVLNRGLVDVIPNANLYLGSADLFAQTAGELAVNGNLYLSGGPLTVAGGSLSGHDTVYGSVVATGTTVNPGNPLGRFWVEGDSTQGSDAQLLVQLGGTASDTYDRLIVSGAAALGGTLYVTNANGYAPPPGQSFTILTAASVTGTFDRVESWADSDCSLGFDVVYNATSVVITAVDGSANVFCSNFEDGSTGDWSSVAP